MDALLSVARARGAAAAAALADAPPGLHAAVALEALYWAASLALLLRRPRKDAHVPPISYPLILGALFVVASTYAVGTLSAGAGEAPGFASAREWLSAPAAYKPYAYAALGAIACVVSLLVHHPSTSLVVIAAAVLLALADSGGWALGEPALRSALTVNGGVFAVAYVVSRPAFVGLFGPGATLFSIVTLLPLAAVSLSDTSLRGTVAAGAALTATPFLLMLTGHPEYLRSAGTHWRTRASTAVVAGAMCVSGALVPGGVARPMLLAAGLTAGSAALLARLDARRPPVLGPFYSYERRASVLAMVAVTLVAVQLAAAQDAAQPVTSHAHTLLPGFALAAGPHLPALLLVTCGYAATVLGVGAFTLALHSIAPATASAYRAAVWDLGLTLFFLGSGTAVLAAYTTLPGSIAAGVRAVVAAASPFVATTAAPLVARLSAAFPAAAAAVASPPWSPAWSLAFATAGTFGLACFLHRALSRCTALWAPVVADVLTRAPPTTRAAALTFNGSPSDEDTPRLLALLAERGARATFFVTAEDATLRRALVTAIAAAGHEVGLLGGTYPSYWTPWGVGDDIVAGIAAITEALGPVAAQAAHAADIARSSALLSNIQAARRDSTASGGSGGGAPTSGGGLRRRHASFAASATDGAGTAASSAPSSGSTSPTAASDAAAPPAAAPSVAWYRPQDASRGANELRAANARGLGVALWSCCPFDWDAEPGAVRARVDAQLSAQSAGPADVSVGGRGAVIALTHTVPRYLEAAKAANRPAHDVVRAAAEALDALSARGVPSVRLSVLAPSHGRAAPTELFPT